MQDVFDPVVRIYAMMGRFSTRFPRVITRVNAPYPRSVSMMGCSGNEVLPWRMRLPLAADGKLLSSCGAAAAENFSSVLRGHSRAKSVCVFPFAFVGLKCAFHRYAPFLICILFSPTKLRKY